MLLIVSIIVKTAFKEFNIQHKTEIKQLIESQALLVNAIALSKNTLYVLNYIFISSI